MTSSRVDDPVAVTEEALPLTMAKANHILDNREQAGGDVKEAARDAPSMAKRGSSLLDQTGEILDAVETLWPVRSPVPQRGHEWLPVDRHE